MVEEVVTEIPPQYAHQAEAIRRIAARPSRPAPSDAFALLMEMGTGKSRVIVDEWRGYVNARMASDILVIAPAGSYRNWYEDRPDEPSEFTKWMTPEARARIAAAGWVSGGSKSSREAMREIISERRKPRVLVVNVEALSSVDKAKAACREFVETTRRGVTVVVDESTRIKGSSLRTKAVKVIGRQRGVVARRIMTGLVTPRSPLDLFHQYNFLDSRILRQDDPWLFKRRYAVMKKTKVFDGFDDKGIEKYRKIDMIVGYQNQEELRERIAPYSYRVLKKDCLDIPEKIYMPFEFIDLTDVQRKHYMELREYATTQLDSMDHVTATAAITMLAKLHHICLGFVKDENGVEHGIKSNRPKALCEIVDAHYGKTVIWVNHHYSVKEVSTTLRREFGEGCVAHYWGGNRSTRGEEEYLFKRDDRKRFMVATEAAGGVGNNWTVAANSVYYSNSFDLEHRAQSEDRTHRSGTDRVRGASYQDMITRGTVERKIVQSLRKKIDMATAVMGDGYRKWIV